MNVEFRASFVKDLRHIKNKELLNRIKQTIELVEKADQFHMVVDHTLTLTRVAEIGPHISAV